MTGVARHCFSRGSGWYKINLEKKKSKIDLLQNSKIFFRMMMTKVRGVLREEKKLAGSNCFRCWPIFFGIQSIKIPQKHEKFKTSKFPQNQFFFFLKMKSLRKFKYSKSASVRVYYEKQKVTILNFSEFSL